MDTNLKSILEKMMTDTNDRFEKHPGITCKICQTKGFSGYRYVCLDCENYDLCEDCYEDDLYIGKHKKSHLCLLIMKNLAPDETKILSEALVDIEKFVENLKDLSFYGSGCNSCQKGKNHEVDYIRGPLLKCDECFNYKLCWDCYKIGFYTDGHTKDHKMIANLVAFREKFDVQNDLEKDKKLIGKGNFGSVMEARLKSTKKAVALKLLTSNKDNQVNEKTFFAELQAYSEIFSSNILRYYGYCIRPSSDGKDYYILTELMPNGTLDSYLRGSKKKEMPILYRKFLWMVELMRGIRRIHKKGFVHKDIKPDNILFSNVEKLKIGDMGVACHERDEKGFFTEFIAPKFYSAPEIIKKEPFTESADIFSFALVMNFFFTGKEHERPRKHELKFAELSNYFRNLILRCVDNDPAKRPTAVEIVEIFKTFDRYFKRKVDLKIYRTYDEVKKDEIFLEIYNRAKAEEDFEFL